MYPICTVIFSTRNPQLNLSTVHLTGPRVRGGGPAVQRGPEAHGAVAEPRPGSESDGSAAASRRLGGHFEVAAFQPGRVVGFGEALQAIPLRILLRTEQLLQKGTDPDS